MAAKKMNPPSTIQEGRVGKKQLAIWVDEEVAVELKVLAARLGTSYQALIEEEIVALLRKHSSKKQRE
jgi:hypothetical protein